MAYEPRGDHGPSHDGGFARARGRRPVTDYGSTVVQWMLDRQPRYEGSFAGELERSSASYIANMLPPLARVTGPADTIPTKHLHSSLNKIKHPVNVVRWTPEGRRLLTASSSGEFTLWNGTGFNFETIMQAHDVAIRALAYSHSDDWLLSADHDGIIKYWQPNFNNVKVIQGHRDPIRDIAFSPTDSKFVTASDDSTLKIFDFAEGVAESTLQGHGWDAKSCDWHPTKGLIVSGSKDHLVKLWDPRTQRCLTTLHGHKNNITKTLFERVMGHCLATSARDSTARVFDLRMMRDISLIKGHEKDISTLAWHPVHPNLLSTGGNEGSLHHYLLDEPNTPTGQPNHPAVYESSDPMAAPPQSIFPAHKVPFAHDFAIWSLDWHPLGHILASGSNDRITRFWSRSRPGDTDVFQDRYHIGEAAAEVQGTWDRRGGRRQRQEEEEQEAEDEMEGLVDQKMPLKPSASGFPGLPGLTLPVNGVPPPPQIPGVGGMPTTSVPPLPFALPGPNGGAPPPLPLPGMDPHDPANFARLAEIFQKSGLSGFPPPPPPGMIPPPGFVPPPNFAMPPGFPLPPSTAAADMTSELAAARRRAPLPSQEESLRLEQKKGNYTRVK
ncbi:WD40 repeat-like protein [Nemania sp. FL0916]|nr:WD40 repeat-like protein [Nemania sp. FL0916]